MKEGPRRWHFRPDKGRCHSTENQWDLSIYIKTDNLSSFMSAAIQPGHSLQDLCTESRKRIYSCSWLWSTQQFTGLKITDDTKGPSRLASCSWAKFPAKQLPQSPAIKRKSWRARGVKKSSGLGPKLGNVECSIPTPLHSLLPPRSWSSHFIFLGSPARRQGQYCSFHKGWSSNYFYSPTACALLNQMQQRLGAWNPLNKTVALWKGNICLFCTASPPTPSPLSSQVVWLFHSKQWLQIPCRAIHTIVTFFFLTLLFSGSCHIWLSVVVIGQLKPTVGSVRSGLAFSVYITFTIFNFQIYS